MNDKKIYYADEVKKIMKDALVYEVGQLVFPDDEALSIPENAKMYIIEGMYRLIAGVEELLNEKEAEK